MGYLREDIWNYFSFVTGDKPLSRRFSGRPATAIREDGRMTRGMCRGVSGSRGGRANRYAPDPVSAAGVEDRPDGVASEPMIGILFFSYHLVFSGLVGPARQATAFEGDWP